jgi:hypothetical protein
MRQVAHHFNMIFENLRSIYRELLKSHYGGLWKMPYHRFEAVRGKIESASVSYLDTGNPKVTKVNL